MKLKLRGLRLSGRQKYMVFAVVFLAVGAMFLMWFLEYRYFLNDGGQAWRFVGERPKVFWYSCFLMWLMLLVLMGITNRPVMAVAIMAVVVIVIGYVHINKFNIREYPLLPEDFLVTGEVTDLSKFVNMWGLMRMVLAGILTLGLGVIGTKFTNKLFFGSYTRKKKSRTWWIRWSLLPRALLISVAVVGFVFATDFARHHKGMRYEPIPWLESEFTSWNQVTNYKNNGFILGFLYNLQGIKLKKPDGYDESKIKAIRAQYRKMAEEQEEEKISLDEEDINVIIVLNESFFDPRAIEEYYPHTGGDITPNLHAIQKKYPYGWMYSTDYGGGTANIEFEALTGLSNYWSNSVPYTDLIPKAGDIPSVASYLKTLGYKATAIHPFNGSMYKRDISLNNLGYEKFITAKEMKYTETEEESDYINDSSAYREVLDVLNSSKKNQIITLVTMQNHLSYNKKIYGEGNRDFILTNDFENLERKSEIETFFQLLYNSDRYLGEFIKEIEKSEKKVVVLFFGDHSPGLFGPLRSNEDEAVHGLVQKTPYFVYANFELAEKPKTLPTTTPNCLPNTMFNLLGAKKPTMFYLLDEVCEETPILANVYFNSEAPFVYTALSQYELINYDILGGRKYWMK